MAEEADRSKPQAGRRGPDVKRNTPVPDISKGTSGKKEGTSKDGGKMMGEVCEDEKDVVTGIITEEFTELKEMLDNRLITKNFFNAMSAAMEDRFKDIRHAVLESAMVDVAMMREDFKAYCDDIENNIDGMDSRSVLESFKTFMIDIENVLFRNGVEIYRMSDYSRTMQKIDKVTMTDDPELDLKINKSLTDGYSIDKKVIYPERIDIYRLRSRE